MTLRKLPTPVSRAAAFDPMDERSDPRHYALRLFATFPWPHDPAKGWPHYPANWHLNSGKGLVSVDAGGSVGYEPGWATSDDEHVSPTDEHLSCKADSKYAMAEGTWSTEPASGENRPINCVNWYEAYAFCIWDGGFLPSESEGLYAAVGGDEQRMYPWGSETAGTHDAYAIFGCHYPVSNGSCLGISNIAPVGSVPAGAGRWGQLDLGGNISQWQLDYWYASASGVDPVPVYYVEPCLDCAYLAPTLSSAGYGSEYEPPVVQRINAGASFVDAAVYVGGSGIPPEIRDPQFGFRCARVPD